MTPFRALVIDKKDETQSVGVRPLDPSELMEGNVLVRVTHSTVNYKDGLALTGKAPVVRRFPMVPGIDFAGIVEQSDDPTFKKGDTVVLNGWGTGETHLGAYADYSRVKADWLIRLPQGLNAAEAMAIGTAGYTAMLAVMALEHHGLTPDRGAAIVTGAAGGVGSVAISLLAKAGWSVIASTGRMSEADYLKSLGASDVIDRAELSGPAKPLAKERWAAGVDSVGSTTLANLIASTRYGGAIAACGLAQGMDLPTSVAPFILRGVALLGIDSVMCPKAKRAEAWTRLARDLDRAALAKMTSVIGFVDIQKAAQDIMAGQIRGRVVVDMAK